MATNTSRKSTKSSGTVKTAAAGRGRTSPAAVRAEKVKFARVLEDVMVSVSKTDRDSFVSSVVGSSAELDSALWGRAPAEADRRSASLENLRREFEARRTVLQESLTRPEVAKLLGVSEQAVLDRLESGSLVGLKKGREWRLPIWQFSADGERGFVPGLTDLQEVFPGGVVTLTVWVTTPSTDLGGATPAAVLASGRVDEVVQAAKSLTAAAW